MILHSPLTTGTRDAHFKEVIRNHFSASEPVSNHELLRGRADVLKKIDRAFATKGRHIFVYGERGVGKTSLARSAASWHQPSELGLMTVQCERAVTAYDVMKDIASQMISTKQQRRTESVKVTLAGLTYKQTKELQEGTVPEISTINEAFAVVKQLASNYQEPPVIIVDEYHKLEAGEDREKVADFVRGISDQEIPLRFIICGVGETLEEMISRDPSHGRFLKPIPLERITIDARQDILTLAAEEIELQIDRETLTRAAIISDGYPYYVKLIGEHLFWSMLDDETEPKITAPKHFDEALLNAVEDAEANFKETYETATQKYKDEYNEVLWAFADSSKLERKYDEVYENSYLPMMEERRSKPITCDTFYKRVRKLCDTSHGAILTPKGNGWYKFTENRVRGYVRLIAERNGVQLGSEHHLGVRRKNN